MKMVNLRLYEEKLASRQYLLAKRVLPPLLTLTYHFSFFFSLLQTRGGGSSKQKFCPPQTPQYAPPKLPIIVRNMRIFFPCGSFKMLVWWPFFKDSQKTCRKVDQFSAMTFFFFKISSNLLNEIGNSCSTKRYKFVAPTAKNFVLSWTTL